MWFAQNARWSRQTRMGVEWGQIITSSEILRFPGRQAADIGPGARFAVSAIDLMAP